MKSSLSRLLAVRTLVVTLVLLLAIGVAVLATADETVTGDGYLSGFRKVAETDRTVYAEILQRLALESNQFEIEGVERPPRPLDAADAATFLADPSAHL